MREWRTGTRLGFSFSVWLVLGKGWVAGRLGGRVLVCGCVMVEGWEICGGCWWEAGWLRVAVSVASGTYATCRLLPCNVKLKPGLLAGAGRWGVTNALVLPRLSPHHPSFHSFLPSSSP